MTNKASLPLCGHAQTDYEYCYHTDLENWNGTDRHHFNAIVTDQDLVEVLINACT